MSEAWQHDDYLGPLIWVAMTVGARRGELCALRWNNIHVRHQDREQHDCITAACEWWLEINTNVAQSGTHTWTKNTKTHQSRRVALDVETIAVLTDHRQQCGRIASSLGLAVPNNGFVFTSSPIGDVPLVWHSLS